MKLCGNYNCRIGKITLLDYSHNNRSQAKLIPIKIIEEIAFMLRVTSSNLSYKLKGAYVQHPKAIKFLKKILSEHNSRITECKN